MRKRCSICKKRSGYGALWFFPCCFHYIIIWFFLVVSLLHAMKSALLRIFANQWEIFFLQKTLLRCFLFLYETLFLFPPGSLSNYSLKLLKIGMFFDIKELLEDFSNWRNPKIVFQGATSMGLCSLKLSECSTKCILLWRCWTLVLLYLVKVRCLNLYVSMCVPNSAELRLGSYKLFLSWCRMNRERLGSRE